MLEESLSMMNQETYVNIEDLHKQGWTINEIAAEVGFHPVTVSRWLKSEGPPGCREVPDDAKVMTGFWRARIETLITKFPRLLGVSVHNRLRAEGFGGGYSTVTRVLREIRGPRFRAADRVSVPIYTDPGEEAQFDFCDLGDWAARWGWSEPLMCFGMILCWSRWRIWWFTTSEDRHHTFEGMARFFDAAGGVPAANRTDRMGALGTSQGRRFRLHAPTVEFAAHHATLITSCKAGDAKRKGKVERPFRQLQETFLPELEIDAIPASIAELNIRAAVWLDERVHGVASRATGERPVDRLVVERPFLARLAPTRFDTDYVEIRRVHNILPFVHLDGVRYSVPPEVLGQKVEIRRAVDETDFEIRWAGKIVASHRLVAGHGIDVWDPAHRFAAEHAAMTDRNERPQLRLIETEPVPAGGRLELGEGFDVEAPDLALRYPIAINDEGEVTA